MAVAVSALWLNDGGILWIDCALGWTLLTLAWIDLEWMILPDVLTLPLLLAGLIVGWIDGPDALMQGAAGAATGWLGFELLAIVYRRFRHREGLGAGDAKLLGAGGAWVGLPLLPTVILLAAVSALAIIVPMQLLRQKPMAETRFPFGPWLALAIWIVWLLR